MSNKPNLLIHTVAIKDGAVQIRYSELNAAEGMDIKQLYSCESPLPGLPTSIQAFVEDLIEMCELPEELKVNTRIDTVDVTYYGSREQDVEMLDVGLTLSGSRRLESAKDTLKLKSPKKRAIDEDQPKIQLNKDAVPRIHELIMQATRYIKGRRITGTIFDWRAQGELFEEQVQDASQVAAKMRQEIAEGLYTMAEAKELYGRHSQLKKLVEQEGKRLVFGTHGLELKTKPVNERSHEGVSKDLLGQAEAAVLKAGKATPGRIQKELSVGYNLACTLLEALEDKGVVSSPDDAGNRQILKEAA